MKVDTDGMLRHLLNFGSLESGEAFVYRNEVYLKFGESGVELETGISINLDRGVTVHKVNMIASPIGKENT